MKKPLVFILFLLNLVYISNAQIINIPDNNFKSAIINFPYDFDTNNDSEIDKSEIAQVKALDLSNKQITDLTGIEAFTSLTELYCQRNQITKLKLDQNSLLTILTCEDNSLDSLDVSGNPLLTTLYCRNNFLKKLNINQQSKLVYLSCSFNQLSEINLKNKPTLQEADIQNNAILNIDISDDTSLVYLSCSFNKLTALDVSKNKALVYLECQDNSNIPYICIHPSQIPATTTTKWVKETNAVWSTACTDYDRETITFPDSIFFKKVLNAYDLNKNGKIERAEIKYVEDLSISSQGQNDKILNVKGIEEFASLKYLSCNENLLTELDVKNNKNLVSLYCSYNQLTTLDISQNPAMQDLICANNKLNSISLNNNTKLKILECSFNYNITSVDLSQAPSVEMLYCKYNKIESLNLSSLTNLKVLECDMNSLSSLDVTKNTMLVSLSFGNNNVTKLDLSNNPELTSLVFYENKVEAIDISNNQKLQSFDCFNNKIKSLDLSKNLALDGVDCDYNNFFYVCIDASQLSKSYSWAQTYILKFSTVCGEDALVKFPDPKLKQALIAAGADISQDGELDIFESKYVIKADISNKGISDMKGIEEFTGLDTLDCSGNNLTTLDLQKNTQLKWLDCSQNKLTELKLPGDSTLHVNQRLDSQYQNDQLVYLDCHDNKFDLISVKNELTLNYLDASANPGVSSICISNSQQNLTGTWKKDADALWSTCVLTSLKREGPLSNEQEVISIVNILGEEVKQAQATGGVFIYLYKDGSRSKVYRSID